jgi:DNA replication protein DnaC
MSERKSEVLLRHYLKKLKLPTILREYEPVAAGCTKENSDYVTYLWRLVERESLDREKRAAERRVKNARFPIIKTLDTFDFEAQPSLKEKRIRELMVPGLQIPSTGCCRSILLLWKMRGYIR